MTLRDQLDQIARLEKAARDTIGYTPEEFIFREKLAYWYRSGGRELALKGLQAQAMREKWEKALESLTLEEDENTAMREAIGRVIASNALFPSARADLEQALKMNERKET
jgi:hypothetical protein